MAGDAGGRSLSPENSQAPSGAPTRRRVGNRLKLQICACGSRAHFFGHWTMWPCLSAAGGPSKCAVSPHSPSKCVFQKNTPLPYYAIRDCFEILPYFLLKSEP